MCSVNSNGERDGTFLWSFKLSSVLTVDTKHMNYHLSGAVREEILTTNIK